MLFEQHFSKKFKNVADNCRIVSGRRRYDHVSPALKELRWLQVKEHLYYRDAVMSFKCLTGCAPGYSSTQFSLDEVMSQIAEREVLKCLTYLALEQQVAKGLFFYRAVTLWNSLSNDLCESVNAALGLAS